MSARSFTLNKRRQSNITVEKHPTDPYKFDVYLHGNKIVSDSQILSSCGWKTPTTKTALNRFLDLMGYSDLKITQVKGVWYINDKTFEDNKNFLDYID